jgi:hypothetical protein
MQVHAPRARASSGGARFPWRRRPELSLIDQGGSQASAGPDVEFKRKRYCCSRDALLARQSRMQLGAGHDLEIRPAIVAIMSVNDTRTT